jgi:predicted component of type VI protein secretion system
VEVRIDDVMSSGEMARSLHRIETKLDRAIDDHEQRLRRVERWMWTSLGLASLGAAGGVSAALRALGT